MELWDVTWTENVKAIKSQYQEKAIYIKVYVADVENKSKTNGKGPC